MSAGTDETDRRLMKTVGLVVVLGGLSVSWALWTILASANATQPPWLRVASLTGATLITNLVPIQIRIKSSRQLVSMEEAVLLFGLALLPGDWLIISVTLAVLMAQILQKKPLTKTLFNSGQSACIAGCAVAVAAACNLSGPFTANRHDLPAILAAALTIPIADEVIAIPVIALATRTPAWQLFRSNLDVRVGGMAVRLGLTIIALFAIPRQIVFILVAAPLVMAAIHFVSSNRLRERGERAAWQKLAQTTDEFNEVDLDNVLTSAVRRSAELFSADEVEVRIAMPTVSDRVVRGDGEAIRYDGDGMLAPVSTSHPIAVPLVGHDGAGVGELRLLFEGETIALTEREQFTLRAFAAALSTAIRNAAAFTEAQRLSAEHEHAAKHDPLTGLANRRQLYDAGDNLLAQRTADGQMGLLLMDLNHFMEVNGMRLVIEASAGVALAPSRGGIEELLRRTDVAMYQAKRAGNRISLYSMSRDTADIGRLALSADLPRAVAQREFTVNFQPIVDLATGQVLATEALARWHHPDRGDLNPTRFLDKVERSGLLAAFSENVLEQALQAAGELRAEGFPLPVAVNVSPRSLLDPTFPDAVEQRLVVAEVAPEALTIELTESLTLSQLDVVDEVLRRLRDLGVRLALDDFGTGYSSLATLARVPVNELKIDRSFVDAMDSSQADAAVVRSTIDLGRSLGMLVVAEGVESEDQRRRLWEQGCPAGQGHLFGRPMTLERLLAALKRGYEDRPATLAAPLHDSASVIRLPARRPVPQPRHELG